MGRTEGGVNGCINGQNVLRVLRNMSNRIGWLQRLMLKILLDYKELNSYCRKYFERGETKSKGYTDVIGSV